MKTFSINDILYPYMATLSNSRPILLVSLGETGDLTLHKKQEYRPYFKDGDAVGNLITENFSERLDKFHSKYKTDLDDISGRCVFKAKRYVTDFIKKQLDGQNSSKHSRRTKLYKFYEWRRSVLNADFLMIALYKYLNETNCSEEACKNSMLILENFRKKYDKK